MESDDSTTIYEMMTLYIGSVKLILELGVNFDMGFGIQDNVVSLSNYFILL